MSLHQTIEVPCPACRKEGPYEMWTTVNRDMDPDAATALAHGELMQFRCAHCKATSPVDHPLLLHAMEKREMVQFGIDGEDAQAAPPMIDELVVSQGIRLWKVTSLNHLMECARLYEAGFDLFAMRIFAERLRAALERSDGTVVEEAHFDGEELVDGVAKVVFAVFVESADEPLRILVDRDQVRANEVGAAPFRERCVPAGVWTAWNRAMGAAGLELMAAASIPQA